MPLTCAHRWRVWRGGPACGSPTRPRRGTWRTSAGPTQLGGISEPGSRSPYRADTHSTRDSRYLRVRSNTKDSGVVPSGYAQEAAARSDKGADVPLFPPLFLSISSTSGPPRRGHGFSLGGSATAGLIRVGLTNTLRTPADNHFDLESQIPANVIPAPTRTSTSSTSFRATYPRNTATIGVTKAMYESEVASIRFRSQRNVTNVTTDPAKARYRIAPPPAGHDGAAHLSPARSEAPASPSAPVPIAIPLKLTGSASWPHRFTATLAIAAHVAATTIASIGMAISDVVTSCPRKITRTPPNPRAIPASFWAVRRSFGRSTWAATAVWNGYVAKRMADRPHPPPFPC